MFEASFCEPCCEGALFALLMPMLSSPASPPHYPAPRSCPVSEILHSSSRFHLTGQTPPLPLIHFLHSHSPSHRCLPTFCSLPFFFPFSFHFIFHVVLPLSPIFEISLFRPCSGMWNNLAMATAQFCTPPAFHLSLGRARSLSLFLSFSLSLFLSFSLSLTLSLACSFSLLKAESLFHLKII
ncbi:uncharacterized protein BJ171DRAFT_162197 [Polychytrium aggregatum]|uniref:uncharacterized protein n=1 Tax=Polychytrium aggregatum TaxID=110093 RepID=UPI0022FF2190|nr:uncharacterized protein BJ171DRAFT_162197 [Polychytrium aggregatum]KAI9202829.1 hypothetical protein BJ171DRAFT_162197 [Polychytrium aggregatum]